MITFLEHASCTAVATSSDLVLPLGNKSIPDAKRLSAGPVAMFDDAERRQF
jgi:hypothetical protein